jgi:hypothetical protein
VLLRRQVVVFLVFVFIEVVVEVVLRIIVIGLFGVFLDVVVIACIVIIIGVVEIVVIEVVVIFIVVLDVVLVIGGVEARARARGDGNEPTSEPLESRFEYREGEHHWSVGHVDILRVRAGITVGPQGRSVTRRSMVADIARKCKR